MCLLLRNVIPSDGGDFITIYNLIFLLCCTEVLYATVEEYKFSTSWAGTAPMRFLLQQSVPTTFAVSAIWCVFWVPQRIISYAQDSKLTSPLAGSPAALCAMVPAQSDLTVKKEHHQSFNFQLKQNWNVWLFIIMLTFGQQQKMYLLLRNSQLQIKPGFLVIWFALLVLMSWGNCTLCDCWAARFSLRFLGSKLFKSLQFACLWKRLVAADAHS